MPGISSSDLVIRARCLRLRRTPALGVRSDADAVRHASDTTSPKPDGDGEQSDPQRRQPGAMSRRLQEMSDTGLETGGRSARKAVQEAGFGDQLRRDLEKKIADASLQSEAARASPPADTTAGAETGKRVVTAAQAWTGTESTEDASFKMLDASHRPLRNGTRTSSGPALPSKIRSKISPGSRLASARERSALYGQQQGLDQQQGLSHAEREKFREELQHRFGSAARAVPASIQGLTSLANKRIEDAIARGQFKNLPDRGKKMERDYNANSPFINTTEYFLNKMIKKQEIVPPWIEKQQEVVSTASTFRRRLRADWKRHVSRSIASRGGSLESQMKLAEEYAFAEAIHNSFSKKTELISLVNQDGDLSQVTISGTHQATSTGDATVLEEEIQIVERTFEGDGSLKSTVKQVIVPAEQPDATQAPSQLPPRRPTVDPFRDAAWEAAERSYQTLAIQNLNALTRSYNLMAPNLAKKPYFSLERELQQCFADVASQVAPAIRERALAPKLKNIEVIGHNPGGVLNKFSIDKATHVYDERKPQYGFKEFWRDLFAPKS